MVQTAATERFSATGSAAVNSSFAPATKSAIFQIKFTLQGGNGQGADTFLGAIVSALGTPFNGSLASQVMTGLNTYIFYFSPGFILFNGDSITFTFPNSGNLTWGLEVDYAGIF